MYEAVPAVVKNPSSSLDPQSKNEKIMIYAKCLLARPGGSDATHFKK